MAGALESGDRRGTRVQPAGWQANLESIGTLTEFCRGGASITAQSSVCNRLPLFGLNITATNEPVSATVKQVPTSRRQYPQLQL